jgi:hypothetical protein
MTPQHRSSAPAHVPWHPRVAAIGSNWRPGWLVRAIMRVPTSLQVSFFRECGDGRR